MTEKSEKIVIHLVPSAHWDREWYLSFPRFQTRLVRLIDKVIYLLENDIYPCYLLDGQSVMIEDYLAVKPENEGRLKKLISGGKLVIGPWYTVPDTFIPCGESLLKNLEKGSELKEKFGGLGKVAYTPDSFGLNSQFAQIVNKYGYDYVYFSRGARLENALESGKISDLYLVSKDGTKLLAECDKYSTGSGLVVPGIWKNFEKHKVEKSDAIRCADWTFDYQSTRTSFKNRLWICGTDHLEPREDLPKIAEFLNKKYDNVQFKLSTIDDYFSAISKEKPLNAPRKAEGEQRGNYDKHYELSNTLSSRADIKLLNREAENLMFGVFESLDIFADYSEKFGYLDRRAIAEHAYKELLKSHAHDSICTCGSEEMCADEKDRLRGVKEVASELIKEDLSKIGSSLKRKTDGGEILVFNPLPYDRTEIVDGFISVPYDVDGNKVADENGNVIESSFVKVLFKKRIDIETMKYTSFDEIALDETRTFLPAGAGKEDIQTGIYYRFTASVKAMSFARYGFTQSECADGEKVSDEKRLVSGEISAEITECGDIVIKRKDNEVEFYPVIDVDDGDSYTYANKGGNPPMKANEISVGKTVENDIYVEKKVEYLFKNVGTTSGEVKLAINLRIDKNDDKVKFTAEINNENSYGFRLRIEQKTKGKANNVLADTPFDMVERPVGLKKDLSKDIFTCSMRNVLDLPLRCGSVSVVSASFYEYEAWTDGADTFVDYTLLRSDKKVYDTFLPTKDESGAGKGMRWQSESLKMQGRYSFKFAVRLYDGKEDKLKLLNDALKYQFPLVAFGISPCGEKEIREYSGFSLTGAVFSRIVETKENGKKFFAARVYNPCDKACKAEIICGGREISKMIPAGKIAEIELTT